MSDYIDTWRGSIGSEARTRLNEAVRQLEAADKVRKTDVNEAIKRANGASLLAAQAQQLANADVQAGQRAYQSSYRGGSPTWVPWSAGSSWQHPHRRVRRRTRRLQQRRGRRLDHQQLRRIQRRLGRRRRRF